MSNEQRLKQEKGEGILTTTRIGPPKTKKESLCLEFFDAFAHAPTDQELFLWCHYHGWNYETEMSDEPIGTRVHQGSQLVVPANPWTLNQGVNRIMKGSSRSERRWVAREGNAAFIPIPYVPISDLESLQLVAAQIEHDDRTAFTSSKSPSFHNYHAPPLPIPASGMPAISVFRVHTPDTTQALNEAVDEAHSRKSKKIGNLGPIHSTTNLAKNRYAPLPIEEPKSSFSQPNGRKIFVLPPSDSSTDLSTSPTLSLEPDLPTSTQEEVGAAKDRDPGNETPDTKSSYQGSISNLPPGLSKRRILVPDSPDRINNVHHGPDNTITNTHMAPDHSSSFGAPHQHITISPIFNHASSPSAPRTSNGSSTIHQTLITDDETPLGTEEIVWERRSRRKNQKKTKNGAFRLSSRKTDHYFRKLNTARTRNGTPHPFSRKGNHLYLDSSDSSSSSEVSNDDSSSEWDYESARLRPLPSPSQLEAAAPKPLQTSHSPSPAKETESGKPSSEKSPQEEFDEFRNDVKDRVTELSIAKATRWMLKTMCASESFGEKDAQRLREVEKSAQSVRERLDELNARDVRHICSLLHVFIHVNQLDNIFRPLQGPAEQWASDLALMHLRTTGAITPGHHLKMATLRDFHDAVGDDSTEPDDGSMVKLIEEAGKPYQAARLLQA